MTGFHLSAKTRSSFQGDGLDLKFGNTFPDPYTVIFQTELNLHPQQEGENVLTLLFPEFQPYLDSLKSQAAHSRLSSSNMYLVEEHVNWARYRPHTGLIHGIALG